LFTAEYGERKISPYLAFFRGFAAMELAEWAEAASLKGLI